MNRAEHIIDTVRQDAARRVPSHKESGTYGLITKVAQLESECGSLAAHIRVLCSEIADLQARLDPPAAAAGQYSAAVRLDGDTVAHVVWAYEGGYRGVLDARIVGNAVQELGWFDDESTPIYVRREMDRAESAEDKGTEREMRGEMREHMKD